MATTSAAIQEARVMLQSRRSELHAELKEVDKALLALNGRQRRPRRKQTDSEKPS